MLLAAAFIVDVVALFPVALFLMGVGKSGAPVWTNLFMGGVAQLILGISAIAHGDAVTGFAILTFAWIFCGVGWMAYRGFEATGIGNFLFATALVFVIYAIFYLTLGLYTWVAIMVAIVAILCCFAAMDWGKLSPKATGVATMLFVILCFVVGLLLVLGVQIT